MHAWKTVIAESAEVAVVAEVKAVVVEEVVAGACHVHLPAEAKSVKGENEGNHLAKAEAKANLDADHAAVVEATADDEVADNLPQHIFIYNNKHHA